MANFDVTAISGGDVAGGLFNLSDADLIAEALQAPAFIIINIDPILSHAGATTGATDETWGMAEV